MNKQDLNIILDNIKTSCNDCLLSVTDKDILDNAVKIYISEYIKNGKQEIKKTDDLATEKQINLLNKLKVKYAKNITKQEAKILISENIKK